MNDEPNGTGTEQGSEGVSVGTTSEYPNVDTPAFPSDPRDIQRVALKLLSLNPLLRLGMKPGPETREVMESMTLTHKPLDWATHAFRLKGVK